jgi:hypothetical protein
MQGKAKRGFKFKPTRATAALLALIFMTAFLASSCAQVGRANAPPPRRPTVARSVPPSYAAKPISRPKRYTPVTPVPPPQPVPPPVQQPPQTSTYSYNQPPAQQPSQPGAYTQPQVQQPSQPSVSGEPTKAPEGPEGDIFITQKEKPDPSLNDPNSAKTPKKSGFSFLVKGTMVLREMNFPYAVLLLSKAIEKSGKFSRKEKAGAYWNRAIANKGRGFESEYQMDLKHATRLDKSVPKPKGLDVTQKSSIIKAMYSPTN